MDKLKLAQDKELTKKHYSEVTLTKIKYIKHIREIEIHHPPFRPSNIYTETEPSFINREMKDKEEPIGYKTFTNTKRLPRYKELFFT